MTDTSINGIVENKNIDIVIPIFNEGELIEELVLRLKKVINQLRYDFRIIFVDDGSQDNSIDKILSLQSSDCSIAVVKLSRNWGFQNAYNAGLDYSSGDAVIFMDGDLEDPPEIIPEFIKKWEEGFHVVYAVKKSRQVGIYKRFLFAVFYYFMEHLSDVFIDKQAGMFSLMDKKVVTELKKCKERNKYYVGLRFFTGFRQAKVLYDRGKRQAGKPKQDFKRLRIYALNAFFSFSFIPIRMLTYFGISILFMSLFVSIILVIIRILNVKFYFLFSSPGWTSIVLLLFFILGIQIIFLGIIGEYITRIFDEVRNRPYYMIEHIYDCNKIED